jgi:hypothetical protein
MSPNQAANDWIARNGLGRALWFARQNIDPGTAQDRFIADQPDSPPETLSAVFGVALTAIAAGRAIETIGTGSGTTPIVPPTDPTVNSGEWRYRFLIVFTPNPDYPNLRTAYRSHVEDFTHELSQDELDALEEQWVTYWRRLYQFTKKKYGADFIVESITVGPGVNP